MKKNILKERIENYKKEGIVLDAFILQSAYLESLIKLFVETKLTVSIRGSDDLTVSLIKKIINKYNLSKLIYFLFSNKWLPKEYKTLFDNYRQKRNEVMHDLLRQISSSNFDEKIESAYEDGEKISSLKEFFIIDSFYGALEKGNSRFTYDSNLKKKNIYIKTTERENDILRLRLNGDTYQSIAKKFDVTGERIRQILNNTILKLNGAIRISNKKFSKLSLDELIKLKEVRKIISQIVKEYKIPEEDLLGNRRKANLVFPRHLAIFFLKEKLKLSFPQIAKIMRKRDHTTIMHAYRKMEKLIDSEKIKIK